MKLKHEDACYVLGYKKPHKIAKVLCDWDLYIDAGCFTITADIKVLPFILLYIPWIIYEIANNAWNYGLKEFKLPTRTVFSQVYWFYGTEYYRLKDKVEDNIWKMITNQKLL